MCDQCYTTLRRSHLEWLGVQYLLSTLPAGGGTVFSQKIRAAVGAVLTNPVKPRSAEDMVKVEMTRGEWHALIRLFCEHRSLAHRYAGVSLTGSLATAVKADQWREVQHAVGKLTTDTHVPAPRIGIRWTDNSRT